MLASVSRDKGTFKEYWECDRKTYYPSKEAAYLAIERIALRTGQYLRPYKCRFCTGWHLSSRPKKKQKSQRKEDNHASDY